MHELQVMERILSIVLDAAKDNSVKKIVSINLELGALCDFQEKWMNRYFASLADGTSAEGARIILNRKNAEFECTQCGNISSGDIKTGSNTSCPICGGKTVFIGTADYVIRNIEVI